MSSGRSEERLAPIRTAHAHVVGLIQTIPGAALDWQPDGESWSCKRIVAHIAHAYDFYLLIVEQARATDFEAVTLSPALPGWGRVLATDAAVLACEDVPAVLAQLTAAYERALAVV